MTRLTPRLVLFATLALLVGACVPETDMEEADASADATPGMTAAADVAAEEQAIRDRVAAWERAANESPEAFAAFYTDDGVLMAPNAPPAEGPAAIAELMGGMMGSVENITFEPLSIDIADSGDLAVELGRYTLRGTGPDGTAFDDEGSYVVGWEKENGQWMVIADIFNTDRPAPDSEGM